MAGQGRGAANSAGVTEIASEREFFGLSSANDVSVPVFPGPASLDLPRRDGGGESHIPEHPNPFERWAGGIRKRSLAALRNRAVAAAIIELDRGAMFLLVPVFLVTGVVYYFSLDVEPGFLQPVSLILALGIVARLTPARPATNLAVVACLLCVLGFLAAKFETWRAGTQTLGSEISTQITGRVVSIDTMETGRQRLTLDVISTSRPKLRYAPARVRISARFIPQGTTPGATVSGYARLLPPTGPVRPGSYDFSFQSYFDRIGASGFFLSNPRLEPGASNMPVSALVSSGVESARQAIAARIRQAIGGAEGEIAAALIVGVRAGIPNAVNEAMRKTGIFHIISISGLHMALVAGTIMVLLRGAFALFPDFSSRRPVKKYAATAALLAITAYLGISGVVVAAERSYIMLAVMLIAVLFDRAALTMRNLAISAIVVIAMSPHEVVGPSFQMSFAATAALVGAYAAWSDFRANRGENTAPPRRSLPGFVTHKFMVAMVGLAVTSIVAGSATTLYAMWHFQRVAPLSLVANLAIMPVVSLVVMPFAVLSALAMPFGLDGPFLYVMGKGLTVMIALSDWIAARSPIDAVGLVSARSVFLVTVALVIATMATTWLRLAALPFALAGLLTIPSVRTPDVLVSEDGRLVAVPIGGGELAVNRARPNEFTLDNWRRALNAETVVLPEAAKAVWFDPEQSLDLPYGTPFLCTADVCVARQEYGAIVVHASDAKSARPACGFAALIVIDDATARDPCPDLLVSIITKRQLGRSGSAEIFFDRSSAVAPTEIRFAVEELYRPWHTQRRFTREARGLPPYQKADRTRNRPADAPSADAKSVQ